MGLQQPFKLSSQTSTRGHGKTSNKDKKLKNHHCLKRWKKVLSIILPKLEVSTERPIRRKSFR